jgi:hypothetical protein
MLHVYCTPDLKNVICFVGGDLGRLRPGRIRRKVTGRTQTEVGTSSRRHTNFGHLALARLSDEVSWLVPPDTAGTCLRQPSLRCRIMP